MTSAFQLELFNCICRKVERIVTSNWLQNLFWGTQTSSPCKRWRLVFPAFALCFLLVLISLVMKDCYFLLCQRGLEQQKAMLVGFIAAIAFFSWCHLYLKRRVGCTTQINSTTWHLCQKENMGNSEIFFAKACDEEHKEPEQSILPTLGGLRKRRKTTDCQACKYRTHTLGILCDQCW